MKRNYQLIFHPTSRQIAAAIRLGEAKRRNQEKRERQSRPFVWICENCKKKAYEQSEWNSEPDRITDKPKALTDPAYLERIRTQEIPRMNLSPKPTRDLRKLHLKPDHNPPLHFDTTAVRIPTWIL
jgi:hypothetical protein